MHRPSIFIKGWQTICYVFNLYLMWKESQTTLLFYLFFAHVLSLFYVSLSLFFSLALSLSLFLWFTTVLVRHFSVYQKLWKISNLKIFLRNKEELKEWKYKSHVRKENGWKEFLKGWMSFAWFWPEKIFYRAKQVRSQLEIWKGAVSLPIRSKGRSFEKTYQISVPTDGQLLI